TRRVTGGIFSYSSICRMAGPGAQRPKPRVGFEAAADEHGTAAMGCILSKKWARGDRHAVADSGRACPPPPSGRCEVLQRDHLGHFAQVLGCGGEVGLVFSSVGTAQAQAVRLQDAFEVSEEHLDLLSLAT